MGQEVVFFSNKADIPKDFEMISIYESQLRELAEIRTPTASHQEAVELLESLRRKIKPIYTGYAWRKKVVEMVPKEEFNELKTNRNRNLITKEEQYKLQNLSISIAGMSVGSSLLYGLVGSGIGSSVTLADDDTLDTSNLNRVQATILDIGQQKVQIAARKSLEMNPFVEIVQIGRVTESNIEVFAEKNKTDVIFDEIDDFPMKLRLREVAQKHKIPLIMLTNIGDSVMVDVERYDNNHDQKPFNGLVNEATLQKIRHENIDTKLMKELSIRLVDRHLIPDRAVESLKEIGTNLVGRPQLYGTVALDGGVAPYLIRRIFLSNDLPSGRYSLRLKEIAGD